MNGQRIWTSFLIQEGNKTILMRGIRRDFLRSGMVVGWSKLYYGRRKQHVTFSGLSLMQNAAAAYSFGNLNVVGNIILYYLLFFKVTNNHSF